MDNMKMEKICVLWIVTLLLMSVFVIGSNPAAGGSEVDVHREDPIMIYDVNDLQNISLDLGANYVLANDIDANETSEWNFGRGFEPIGDMHNRFNGVFDGRGYNITNLFINRPDTNYVGLFGSISPEGQLMDVNLVGLNVIGNDNVGGLVGCNEGTVSNSHVTGDIFSDSFSVGGLVGRNSGNITESSSQVEVGGSGFGIGGLVGQGLDDGIIQNSHASGNVIGLDNPGSLGGLVGYNRGLVYNSYATGDTISDGHRVGGLVGQNWGGTIINSHATGDVNGTQNIGGLVGSNTQYSSIDNSYAYGDVTGSDFVGGLAGTNYISTITNSTAFGDVIGIQDVGGLAGRNHNGQIYRSYTNSSVLGSHNIGGLVGYNHDSGLDDDLIISNSYAFGDVDGTEYVGGLVGQSRGGLITFTYSTGSVIGDSRVGGLIGDIWSGGVEEHSFWDMETSGQTYSDGGTGKNTSEMMTRSTFTDAGWDFEEMWWIVEYISYPKLVWQDDLVFAIISPSDGGVVYDSNVTIVWAGGNVESNLDYYEIRLDEGEWENVGLDNEYTYYDLDRGMHTVDIRLYYDNTSSYAVESVTFEVYIEDGTPEYPYMIYDVHDLQNMTNDLSAYYALANDIDASVTVDWNDGAGFEPIGNGTAPFEGGLDGEGHEISGLHIDRPDTDHVGLFGLVDGHLAGLLGGGVIGNVSVADVSVRGNNSVGGLIGYIRYGSLFNVHSQGDVSGSHKVGGLAGYISHNCEIEYSSSTCTVVGEDDVGGFVGHNYIGNTISFSYASGSTTGNENVGGFVGLNEQSNQIIRSYSSGTVTGLRTTGGFVGFHHLGGTIADCYSWTDVTRASGSTDTNFGGFVAFNQQSRIIRCYSTGSVQYVDAEDPDNRGFAGRALDWSGYEMTGNFWDMETSGQISSAGAGGGEVEGKTTNEMMTKETFTGADWDFQDVWWIQEPAYPILHWQDDSPPAPPQDFRASGGDGSVVLSWTPPDGSVDHFTIYRGTSPGEEEIITTVDEVVTYLDSDVTNDVTYFYKITATNAVGESEPSEGWATPRNTTGEVNDPHLIRNVWELQDMKLDPDAHYMVVNHIDASVTDGWNGGAGFEPVGSGLAPFTGVLQGQGYEITGLFIYRPDTDHVGLFGYAAHCSIMDIGLLDVDITGNDRVGGLVGFKWHGTVENAYAAGEVSGENHIGGLVGYNLGSVTESSSSSSINGSMNVGGLIGYQGWGSISDSYATGEVIGQTRVGGLIGLNGESGTVTTSYASGDVYGDALTGGLVGYNVGTVENAYSTGSVTCSVDWRENIGGFVGYNTGTILNSYSIGSVHYDGAEDPTNKGFAGTVDTGGDYEMSGNFWDNQTSGQDETAGNATGLNTSEMMNQTTFVEWDIVEVPSTDKSNPYHIWNIVDGATYPFFNWQYEYVPDAPTPIHDWEDLFNIRDDLLEDYYLANDLNETSDGYQEYVNTSEGWLPLGTQEEWFAGTFEGQGRTISGLYINRPETDHIGLFGYLKSSGTISDVGLIDVDVTGNNSVGGLAGVNNGGTIHKSYVKGAVNGTGDSVGTLLGTNMGTVSHSYATGTVLGAYNVGGLVGSNQGHIAHSYATAEVIGTGDRVGGLVGQNGDPVSITGMIHDSYANGNVSGRWNIGGLVGRNWDTVFNSYAASSVSGSQWVGGLVGYNAGSVDNSFWDVETSDQDSSEGGIGKTTAEMMTEFTYTDWDFDDIWWIVEDATYPLLRFQPVAVGILSPFEGEPLNVSDVTMEWAGGTNNTGEVNYQVRIGQGDWVDVDTNTSHVFTDLVEGEHTVDVKAYDVHNNTASDSVTFLVDLTDPSLYISSPSEGDAISSTNVTIHWEGSDELSGISHYEVRIGEGEWLDKGLNTSHLFTDLEEGDHRVDVRAYDNAGNSAIDNVTFTVDVTPPDVTITSPEEGEIFNVSHITVQWVGIDHETGISHYEIRLNQDDWENVGNETEYQFFDLDDGEHTVYVRAVDLANNTEIDNVTFTVDVTDPTVNITYPEDGDALATGNVTVVWTGSDEVSGIDYYEIRILGEEWINVGENTSYQFTDLEEGDYVVEVKATDKAGNSAIDNVTFTVDVTAPTINIDSPEEGEILNTSDITVQWTGDDVGSGISHYEIRLNDGEWENVGDVSEHTLEGVPDGVHTVYVRAVDNANNTDTDHVTFTVDATPPSVDIISPSEGVVLSTVNVTVEWTGSDDTTGISHYEIRIDGGDWIPKGLQTSHEFTELDEGEHTVDVRATDNAGNSAIDSVTFTVDVSDPALVITSPHEDEIFSTSVVTVEWDGSDDISGIDHYEIRINQGDWTHVGLNESHLFTGLTEGTHFVELIAHDRAGNYAMDNVTFMVDTTPPDVEITSPEHGAVIRAPEVVVEWTGHDNLSGIDRYEIRIDGGDWIDKGLQRTHNFTDLDEGVYWVDVIAYDRAGNSATDTVSFTIDFEISYIVISPDFESISAGDNIVYTARAYDEFGGDKGDVTHLTNWSIEDGAGGYWVGNVYYSEYANDWVVTGEYDGLEDTATLRVLPGDAYSIVLSPQDETITAGDHVDYTALAYDEFGNEKGEVLPTYSIHEDAGGSWSNRRYYSQFAGTWTVTGTYDGVVGTATLVVEPGVVFRIEISPQESTITAGETQEYTAVAYDGYDNEIGDVTADTDWSVDSSAGGHWVGNVYHSESPGTWSVSGTYQGVTSSVWLTVESRPVDHIIIEPQTATIQRWESQTYTATAYDEHGNEIGDVTVDTVWSIDTAAGGYWVGSTYHSAESGTWTVTGTYEGFSHQATLTVVEEETYTMTIDVVGEGWTDPPTGVHEYSPGERVTIEAVAHDGWVFSHWTGDHPQGGSQESTISIDMDQDKVLTAIFVEEDAPRYVLTINIEGMGTVEADPDMPDYPEGTTVTLFVTPEPGWQFVQWGGDLSGSQLPGEIHMNEDKTVTALFQESEADFSVRDFTVSPTEGDEPLTVQITASIENIGNSQGIISLRVGGETIREWTVDPGETVSVQESYTLDDPGLYYFYLGDRSATVTVGEVEVYTLTVLVEGEGSVDHEELHEAGSQVVLNAVPSQGWEFVEWTGDLEGTDNPTTVQMNEDKTITARFREIGVPDDPDDETDIPLFLILIVILIAVIAVVAIFLIKRGGGKEPVPDTREPILEEPEILDVEDELLPDPMELEEE